MADVYASRAELWSAIGNGTVPTDKADRLDLALIVASGWVQQRVGLEVTTEDLIAPYSLDVVACPPAYKAACLAAAVRFFKAPDVPFGVMTAGDMAVTVRTSIPEAEVLLFGHREAFGFS